MCRLHKSASQTFASRKFNVFIDPLVGQVYFRALGNDEREPHSLWTWVLALQQDPSDPARTNSRTERPLAAACSFSCRYRGTGISTVMRIESCFIAQLFHLCP